MSKVKIEFLGPISNIGSFNLEAENISDVIEVLKSKEELKQWLDDLAIAVNDEIITTKDIKLNNGDKISILPPVCGG